MLIKKINILFLCTGNICRSPTAEGIFNKIIKEKQIKNFFYVDSAGTHGFHQGQPPDKRSQRECLKLNVNISKKKSRKFKDRDLNKFDYIIAMDETHLEFIEKKNFSPSTSPPSSLNTLTFIPIATDWISPRQTGLTGKPEAKQDIISVPPEIEDKRTFFFTFE